VSSTLIAILLIFVGEALSIGAELGASRRFAEHNDAYVLIFLWMFPLIALGGALLVVGYMLGYSHLKNIWIIAAVSVSSIVVVEPLLAFLLFRQLPTFGAAIGFALGVLGTLAALFL
jgi:hypothetical protein